MNWRAVCRTIWWLAPCSLLLAQHSAWGLVPAALLGSQLAGLAGIERRGWPAHAAGLLLHCVGLAALIGELWDAAVGSVHGGLVGEAYGLEGAAGVDQHPHRPVLHDRGDGAVPPSAALLGR